MITRNLTLTITDKSVSLDKSIILYQYDRGVTFNFKLVSADYAFNEDEITKARAIIKRPNKEVSVSPIDDILDGTYTFFLDGTYTDDTFEIGIYTMQLQLYSNSDECITIAPFTFEVKELIGIPKDDVAYVGYATVGYASTRGSEVLDTGDLENGEYLETVWVDKDIITSGRLNKIETVLDYLVEDASNNEGSIDGPITDLEVNNSISMGRTGEVGVNSVAIGTNNQAGDNTSAIGYGLIAKAGVMQKGQCVVGKYNEQDTGAYFIVGNGKTDSMRKNAFAVTNSGIIANEHIKANSGLTVRGLYPENIMVGGISDDGSTKQIQITDKGILIRSKVKYGEDGKQNLTPEEDYVPTKEYVDNAIAAIEIPEGGDCAINTINNITFTSIDQMQEKMPTGLYLCGWDTFINYDSTYLTLENKLICVRYYEKPDASDEGVINYAEIINYDDFITYTFYQDGSIIRLEKKTTSPADCATKEYVDDAISNIEISGGKSECSLKVIGRSDSKEPHYFTGDEFTDEEWSRSGYYAVLFNNTAINEWIVNGLCDVYLAGRGLIYIWSPRLGFHEYWKDDNIWVESYSYQYATTSELETVRDSVNSCVTYDQLNDQLNSYATQDYVDNAIANIEIPEGSDNLPIRVIGSNDSEEPHIFTGDEFTDEEWDRGGHYAVLFNNTMINEWNISGLWDIMLGGKYLIYMWSPSLGFHEYWKDEEAEIWVESYSYQYATTSELEDIRNNYATKEELQEALGDIGSILDDLNGEVIE